MQLKTRIIALPLAAVLAAGTFFHSAPAQAAPRSKTYKAGAIALGVLGAYLLSKGKKVEGAAVLGGGYLAYRQGEKERRNERYGRDNDDRFGRNDNWNTGWDDGRNNGGRNDNWDSNWDNNDYRYDNSSFDNGGYYGDNSNRQCPEQGDFRSNATYRSNARYKSNGRSWQR